MISASLSVLTVLVAMLGAIGFLPINVSTVETAVDERPGLDRSRVVADRARRHDPTPDPSDGVPTPQGSLSPAPAPTPSTSPTALPPGSGTGRRIVYALAGNRVWLVAGGERVVRTYPVSGTRFGQVKPGTYDVIRKRRFTQSYHGTERMEFMVTFTYGENAAIGFHDIPVDIKTGKPLQTLDQLGQSLSDGCVRQSHADAKALWEFAPPGTRVVVVS